MFLAKLDTLEHFEINLIKGFGNLIKDVQTFEGGGVEKPLDKVQSFALVFFLEAFRQLLLFFFS